ncbi:hypothetical protein BpHYR1_050790 [Brachionus plicatilis]|uniref:Uncharacterized protein n=1 Tax=Brachionus plicatilis TaxID=10195 RepID=A0A3M7RYF4_BRAPC|nr:hypothetical protein BpHYR1_050790 [Brachionus plicatilis]
MANTGHEIRDQNLGEQLCFYCYNFKIDSVNPEWCNIQSCIKCKSQLMMCKIDYIEIQFLLNSANLADFDI